MVVAFAMEVGMAKAMDMAYMAMLAISITAAMVSQGHVGHGHATATAMARAMGHGHGQGHGIAMALAAVILASYRKPHRASAHRKRQGCKYKNPFLLHQTFAFSLT